MTTTKKIVLAALGVTGGVFAATAAGAALMVRRHLKMVEGHEEEHNLMQLVTFGGSEIKVDTDTDNAYVSCLFGGTTVVLPENPEKDLNLDVCTVFGGTKVIVPESVKILNGVDLRRGSFIEELTDAQVEDGPTLTITGKVAYGSLTIERV
ncbi:MAG: hypothetical protein IK055_00755 [Lachnospiraceae bacterium]|nr:hypothetical protein [Lachnospiraceae bacterium]